MSNEALTLIVGSVLLITSALGNLAQAKTIRKLRDLIGAIHKANAKRLKDVCVNPASYPSRRA